MMISNQSNNRYNVTNCEISKLAEVMAQSSTAEGIKLEWVYEAITLKQFN